MNPEELGLLINALKNKDQGFFLVEVDSVAILNDLMIKLKVAMGQAGKKTCVINFSEKDKEDTVISFLERKLASEPDTPVLFLTNIISFSADADETARSFQLFNQARESMYAMGKCSVFLVDSDVARIFPLLAKDLYSWIPQRYRFGAAAWSPREFSQALRLEEKARFPGDKDREYLRDLIAIYEEQLKDAPENETFLVTNIMTPLADLYRENDQFDEELRLRIGIAGYWEKHEDAYQQAEALNNLGNAYSNLSTGDRAENLKKAIAAYHEALTIYTRDAFPDQHSVIQKSLSDALDTLKRISGGKDAGPSVT